MVISITIGSVFISINNSTASITKANFLTSKNTFIAQKTSQLTEEQKLLIRGMVIAFDIKNHTAVERIFAQRVFEAMHMELPPYARTRINHSPVIPADAYWVERMARRLNVSLTDAYSLGFIAGTMKLNNIVNTRVNRTVDAIDERYNASRRENTNTDFQRQLILQNLRNSDVQNQIDRVQQREINRVRLCQTIGQNAGYQNCFP